MRVLPMSMPPSSGATGGPSTIRRFKIVLGGPWGCSFERVLECRVSGSLARGVVGEACGGCRLF